MSEIVNFPGLGLVFDIDKVALSIGSLTVYWYGIMVTTGILLGGLYAFSRSNEFGVDEDKGLDVIMMSIIGGFVGARIYYVAFTWDYYSQHTDEIFKIWNGGIAIYGGVIGAFITAAFLCRLWHVRILPLADMCMGGLIIGQALGRWGNFFNIEAFGSNTTLPWGMSSPTIANYLQIHKGQLASIGVLVNPMTRVHPTFLYESIWCLIGFILLAMLARRRFFDGELLLIYTIWYGAGRFFIEGLRTDSLMLGSFRVSQILAAVCVIVANAILIGIRAKIRRNNDPTYLLPYGKTQEWQIEKQRLKEAASKK